MRRTRITSAALAVTSLGTALLIGISTPATAAVSMVEGASAPTGDPWVVSLGDSYISGEAGRWAGNQSLSTGSIDALGSAAYWDASGRETINRCHRSRSAGIHIGVVKSMNLACSGAITTTEFDADGNFKPGIDFYDQGGRKGQALMLEDFASQHNVKMVALSIGGNDFHFADIIAQCVKDFLVPLASPECNKDETVNSYISPSAVEKVRADTTQAILNVATAMENAGYQDSDWTLVLQLYPQPLPRPNNMRYTESGYERQRDGGCGFRDADLSWADSTLLPLVNDVFRSAGQDALGQRPSMQLAVMDTSRAFQQRQLCHKDVWRVKESSLLGSLKGPNSWRDSDAVDRSEWVMEINIINALDTYQQESLHPNYWGQLALRNCWRQVWNDGDVRGGACERGSASGLTADCEPDMDLVPTARSAVRALAEAKNASTAMQVSLRCPGITLKPGQEAVLRGRVSQADDDAKVLVQMKWDGQPWRTKATVRPASDGTYSFTTTVPNSAPAGRTYQWRAVAKSGSNTKVVSQTRTSLVR